MSLRRIHPSSFLRSWSLALPSLALLATAPAFPGDVERANEGGGFQTSQTYLGGPGGDTISPLSGDAEIVVAIGPMLKAGGGLELGLTLHYSTKIWARSSSPAEADRYLQRRGPFGVGWKLHVGRLYASTRGGTSEWIYESSDGAQHEIAFDYSTADAYNAKKIRYHGTKDGTFIRAEPLDPNGEPWDPNAPGGGIATWRLYMGNGVIYVLDRQIGPTGTADPNHALDNSDDFKGWYTTRIEKQDAPGHVVGRIDVAYDPDPNMAHCLKQIDFLSPDAGGQLVVRRGISFDNATQINGTTIEGGYTKRIRFPAVDGRGAATATWSFGYEGPVELVFERARRDPETRTKAALILPLRYRRTDPVSVQLGEAGIVRALVLGATADQAMVEADADPCPHSGHGIHW